MLYLHADPADTEFKQALWRAIDRGVAWQLTRILDSGEITTVGNTRVFPGGDKILGVEKNVAFMHTVMALSYYGILTRNASITATANKVATYYTTKH